MSGIRPGGQVDQFRLFRLSVGRCCGTAGCHPKPSCMYPIHMSIYFDAWPSPPRWIYGNVDMVMLCAWELVDGRWVGNHGVWSLNRNLGNQLPISS